jgi:hypothetical protein
MERRISCFLDGIPFFAENHGKLTMAGWSKCEATYRCPCINGKNSHFQSLCMIGRELVALQHGHSEAESSFTSQQLRKAIVRLCPTTLE